MLLSTITLVLGFVNHDYSIQYVADHSSNTMPYVYTWIAFYSGNEGSLLFICTCLSILLFLFIQNKKLNDNSVNFSHLFILIFQILAITVKIPTFWAVLVKMLIIILSIIIFIWTPTLMTTLMTPTFMTGSPILWRSRIIIPLSRPPRRACRCNPREGVTVIISIEVV